MRQLVDEDHLRMAGYDGVHVHLIENRPFIFEFALWNRLQLLRQLDDALAAVSLDNPDHHVFAAAVTADTLAQHAEGFAHARRVPEKELETALGPLGWRHFFEPFFGLIGHGPGFP